LSLNARATTVVGRAERRWHIAAALCRPAVALLDRVLRLLGLLLSTCARNAICFPLGVETCIRDVRQLGTHENHSDTEKTTSPKRLLMRVNTVLIASVTAAACVPAVSTIPNNATPVKPVEVRLSVAPAVAFDRTMAAFIAEGYQVDQANKDAGTIKSVGVMGETTVIGGGGGLFGMFPTVPEIYSAENFMRANIVRADSGSLVYVSLSGRAHPEKGPPTPESALYECPDKAPMKGLESAIAKCRESLAKLKAKVESVAAKNSHGTVIPLWMSE
jgi:hypothetical protein